MRLQSAITWPNAITNRHARKLKVLLKICLITNASQTWEPNASKDCPMVVYPAIKNCASVIAPSVATLFNSTFETGHLPKQFKKATIAPVFKSGDKHVAANYRPISLLPILSKVLEKIIASQLKSFLKEHSLLPAEQFTYRDRHSTEDALVYAVTHCQQCNDTHTNDYLLFCPGTWRCSFSACNMFWMCSYFGLLLNRCRCRLTLC